MSSLTKQQLDLFEQLHNSRLEDYKIFSKRDYRGFWSSIVDKYPESAHFIYELLQNADDAEATEVSITIKQNEMLFKHNGKKHFDITSEGAPYVGDINSITGIGDSSKADNQNKIGKFGVGFKAVFQYTNSPEIYDDVFKFRIENYIVPSLIEQDHPEREEGETLFVFPYKDGRKSHDEIVSRLDNLQNPILFLSYLLRINIKVEGQTTFGDRILSYSKNCREKRTYADGVQLQKYFLKEPRRNSTIFLFTKRIHVPIFGDNVSHCIHVGFYYDEEKKQLITDTKQNIFCFFPTKETFNTCFVSHAPFLLTDNRQNLKPNELLNSTLTEALANLAAKSVVYLKDYGISHNNLIINENITEIFPKYTKNFWEQIDPVLETPIFKAFNKLLTDERIFLSRNNDYLFMKNAYIGSPKELVDLLSKEQFSYLRGEKDGVDFLKWELCLNININRNKIGILNNVKEYTSEDFAGDLTAEFMNQQELKWVTRMYTFLRSAAPKLWKLIGNDKSKGFSSLPFRYAPIVKSQRGEWIPPYLPVNKPNIFFPIKKAGSSTTDNISDYNFINQEYLENDMALKFFAELEIQEPNEYDYIRTVVLEKYTNENKKVYADDLTSDLDVLIGYYRKNPRNMTEFISLVKEDILLAINKEEGDTIWISKPTEVYYPTKILETYFRHEEIFFLDNDFYKDLIDKYGETVFFEFVKLLGVKEIPEIVTCREDYTRIYNPVYKQIDLEGCRFEIYDYELKGFKDSIINVTKELSLYIWNELLPKTSFSQYGNLLVKFWKKYARKSEDAFFQSTFKHLLRTRKWIYDEKGNVFSAEEIALERLAPEYDRGNGLIAFLGIEKKEKSIIELGGTEEQQNHLDLGKRVRDLAGDELSEQEIMQAVAEAKAKKRNGKQTQKPEISGKRDQQPSEIESSKEKVDDNIEEKLNKKWEEKSKSKISRPSHVGSSDNILSGEISKNDQNFSADNDQPFFGASKYKSNDDDIHNNAKAEKKIKTRDTEAQENAQAAHEQVQILELLNNTETYTYKWYKLLMELMHANKSLKTDRHVQIDFSEWEIQCSDKILHLFNPTAPVPSWLTDSDQFALGSMGVKPEKLTGQIVKCDEYSVDFALDAKVNVEDICSKAKKFRLIADNTTNIIDSLEKRFLQLGFEDDYNLNENLPQNIHFIYGPPGTGKTTTLVKSVHDILEGASKKTNILVLTPTNKAADVIAEKMVNDEFCFNYLSRFGATEKLFLIEDAAVVTNRDSMDMDLLPNNIVVTTAARYTYDCLQPDNVFLCDYDWDYIYVDEASMVDLVTITYILYKGCHSKIIIAGDPKQIEPVSQNDMPTYNVYDLVGLHGFADAINNYKRYPVTSLTTQYRSIPSIGEVVSKFAYNGIVKTDPQRKPQKPLVLNGLHINDVNFLGFEIVDLDLIKGLSAIGGSAFHLYSGIFTYNFAEFIVKQIDEHNLGDGYSVGIVCPYRAQADAIKQMIDSRPIASENCSVTCGTVHSFQGDECDIMLIVLNPPINCSQGSHINNENIMNVAMSRARDYLFFIVPSGQTPGFTIKNEIGNLTRNNRSILRCSEVENVMLGSPDYIANNTHVTCHMPVNVYCEESAVYEVRMSDTAIDIKINQ